MDRYRNASPSTRRGMRDKIVLPYHSISELKQEMDAHFGQSDRSKEIINLKANLILALGKKADAQGVELPDKVCKRKRKPKLRGGRWPAWSI